MRNMNLPGRVWRSAGAVMFIVSLACHGRAASAGSSKSGSGMVTAHVVLKEPRGSSVTEVGEYDLKRYKGQMSAEDSVAWLKSLRAGSEILWVDKSSKGVLITVELPPGQDTLRTGVVRDTSTVRTLPPIKRDRTGVCRVEWDLRSSNKTMVEPGLYSIGLESGTIASVFYVVVTGGADDRHLR